jgi:hypothetical protein
VSFHGLCRTLLAGGDAWTDRTRRERILATTERKVTRRSKTLLKLVALSRSPADGDNALVKRLELSAMIADVIGQLREMADARGVEIRVTSPLPTVTVDAARLELTPRQPPLERHQVQRSRQASAARGIAPPFFSSCRPRRSSPKPAPTDRTSFIEGLHLQNRRVGKKTAAQHSSLARAPVRLSSSGFFCIAVLLRRHQ